MCENEKFDICVICSTQNQVVNYIPIVKYGIKIVYNITIGDETEKFNNIIKNEERMDILTQFDNKAWDKNLNDILKEDIHQENICINEKDALYSERVVDAIKKKKLNSISNKNKKILWNITGGQRSVLLGILKYLRKVQKEKNRIIYLEGDTNKMIMTDIDFNENTPIDYSNLESHLNFKKSMKLAGFHVENYTNLLQNNDSKKEYHIYSWFTKADNFKKVRGKLFDLNKEYNEKYKAIREKYSKLNCDKSNKSDIIKELDNINNSNRIYELEYKKSRLQEINKKKCISKENYSKYKNNLITSEINEKIIDEIIICVDDIVDKKELKRDMVIECGGFTSKKFGYIFEKIIVCRILDSIKKIDKNKYFIDIVHSLKVLNSKYITYKNLKNFCEIDIALLSRSGQTLILECKSGTMNSDVGKAREYTTYATSGVYGLPILITPLLQEEVKYIGEIGKKKDCDKQLESSASAVLAAMRGHMDVWCLNNIEQKIESLIQFQQEEIRG